jgi:hypothetical protein
MGKRRLLYLAALAVCVAGLVVLCWPRAISPTTYRKIRAGMNRQQVEALIGLPPDSYYVGPEGLGGRFSQGAYGSELEQRGLPQSAIPKEWFGQQDPEASAAVVLQWWGNRYAIDVAFDESGAAVAWRLIEVFVVIKPTIEQRIRMWLNP